MDSVSATTCPLCGFGFGDDRATGADVTPYAKAYACREGGWRRMAEWVWFAGWERLNHIALMRASVASRRFALLSTMLLSVGLGLFQTTRVGWRWVTASPAVERTGSTSPGGLGWFHAAAAPRPLPSTLPTERYVDLWWSPAQMVIAVVTAAAGALLLCRVVIIVVRAGVTLAHSARFRAEQRMTAAIQYSTAWWVPICVAALVAALLPSSYIGAMEAWRWYPPQRGFVLSAGVLAAFGVVMWWFWLVRLGSTAPVRTRRRVVLFFALGVPVAVFAAAAGWWYGLDALYPPLFDILDLSF